MRQNAASMLSAARAIFAICGAWVAVAACSGAGFGGAVPGDQQAAGATDQDADVTDDGASALTCKASRADCNGRSDDGCEIDTASSPKNCGACGKACSKGEVCARGKCSSSCPAGLVNCGGACVDTDSDVDHCGKCGGACAATANGVASCAAAKCTAQCNAGYESCATGCCEKPPVPPAPAVQPGGTVAAGGNHSCAITPQGALKCWGSNGSGKLGDNTQTDRKSAVAVSGLGSGVLAVGAGNTHSCALVSPGEIRCWGGNTSAQLGSGDNTLSKIPKTVTGLGSGAIAIGVGRDHSCAIVSGGGVKCWGTNEYGQLGNGTKDPTLVPVDVTGLPRAAVALAVGSSYSCALLDDASVACWGANDEGQLGDGTLVDRPTPVLAASMPAGVSSIAAGVSHTCVLAAGKVFCWGDNGSGQLGDGTANRSDTPVEVKNLANVVQIDAGTFHTCAVDNAGAVKCWGEGTSGQLGDGSTSASATVVSTSLAGVAVKEVAGGSAHSCARTQGDNMKCWGSNSRGQLGNNSTSPSSSPVNVQAF